MKTILMAGGRGTRISSVSADIPKPMISICGKPVLEHELECLREQGFTDIIITVGHLAQCIIDYFGNGCKVSPATGHPFGVNIQYYIEKQPLGNAGAVFKLWESGKLNDDFMLLVADALFNIDFNRFVQYHQCHHALATIFTHPNSHPYDSGLVAVNEETHIVTGWLNKEDKRPAFYKNRVNAGLHVLSPEILTLSNIDPSFVGKGRYADLDRDILKPLVSSGKIFAYDSPEYCRDMGTPERFRAVLADAESGIVKARNLRNKQKAIFIECNWLANICTECILSVNDFKLHSGAAEAVQMINDSEFLCIVIMNQPIIEERKIIDNEPDSIICSIMETLLGKKGAYADAFYRYPCSLGESDFQKMKQSLLLRASEDYNISLEDSWVIEDSGCSAEDGIWAGSKTVFLISTNDGKVNIQKSGLKKVCEGNSAFKAEDLQSAVKVIFRSID